MTTSGYEQLTVSAVMLKKESQHPWGESLWLLSGIVPGVLHEQLVQIESQGELHIWPDLTINIYPLHCDSYYQNLISQQPKIYLVCNQIDSSSIPEPLLLTVDYDEAASYMETGELVVNTALPENIRSWLEKFVLTHYKPEAPKKRRRQKWHNEQRS